MFTESKRWDAPKKPAAEDDWDLDALFGNDGDSSSSSSVESDNENYNDNDSEDLATGRSPSAMLLSGRPARLYPLSPLAWPASFATATGTSTVSTASRSREHRQRKDAECASASVSVSVQTSSASSSIAMEKASCTSSKRTGTSMPSTRKVRAKRTAPPQTHTHTRKITDYLKGAARAKKETRHWNEKPAPRAPPPVRADAQVTSATLEKRKGAGKRRKTTSKSAAASSSKQCSNSKKATGSRRIAQKSATAEFFAALETHTLEEDRRAPAKLVLIDLRPQRQRECDEEADQEQLVSQQQKLRQHHGEGDYESYRRAFAEQGLTPLSRDEFLAASLDSLQAGDSLPEGLFD
mmetsp:Transcript_37329/g.93747  ORF Transcript_37329/g.93747 Transcript_37329/m.93747 type:complete len:351 (-) Transcript_37329:155-1207(-)|eukprot:CAMPEP_0177664232 /NCGR_PEP_ID=MMETSP0447-20121125/20373_1 /TAXON_ID=0 /ORGANISM="Stygamoeba regulata, Strain BSH-02190019" /LENGTH=350 /DNA_ID=CAMNT_0019170169 /DNA_START=1119 /DNA_END=2171 /DNA_ORIENTATION=-